MDEQSMKYVKEEFVDLMTKAMKEDGRTNPVFALIAFDKEYQRPSLMLCPLPSKLVSHPDFKTILINDVLPSVAEDIVDKQGIKVYATCMAAEAKMWVSQKKQTEIDDMDNMSDEELSEKLKNNPEYLDILLIQFEDKYDKEMMFYEVIKNTSVAPDGELVTATDLKLNTDLSFNTSEDSVQVRGLLGSTFKIFWRAE